MPDGAPDAGAGDIAFNVDESVMQYCNGTNWINMGGGGGSSSMPTCANNEILRYDDGDDEWDCVAMASAETDPQVNTLTNNKWCTSNGTVINCASDLPIGTLTNGKFCTTNGTTISCTSDGPSESDPQVNTLTNGKWCTSNGTVINCTTDAPVLTETDPQVGAVTNNQWCRGDGTQVVCDQDPPAGGGALACQGGTNPQVYNGKCYTSFTRRDLYGASTFGATEIEDMRSVCKAWGGDALIINDASEQAFITSNYASGQGWLAMTDNGMFGSSEGNPRWYNSTLPYSNFNASSNQNSSRDAVRLNADGTWRYETGGTNRDFYCESDNAYSSAYAQDGRTCLFNNYMEGETELGCTASYACVNGIMTKLNGTQGCYVPPTSSY